LGVGYEIGREKLIYESVGKIWEKEFSQVFETFFDTDSTAL